MPEKSNTSGFVILAIFALIVGGLGYLALKPPEVLTDESPRIVRLDQFNAQFGLAENQRLVLAPWLSANAFNVGAAFAVDGSFAMARSTACDQVQTQPSQVGLSLSDNSNFAVTPDVELVSVGKISANATRAVEYRVDVIDAVIAPGEVELLNDLYGDPDCLAAIANRDVLVLYGIFKGNEEFALKRGANGSFSVGAAIANLKENLGLETTFSDEDTFKRTEVAMYWALTKVHLDEPELGAATLADEVRMAIATDLVANENDYAQRAIPNTTIKEPSNEDVANVLDQILRSN